MSPAEMGVAALIGAAAILYSAVGHGGASAYLAVMALAGLAPEAMRPTALVLNILVSSAAATKFGRAGHFRSRLFWPFAATSVPGAFLGGLVALPLHGYRVVLGGVLLYAAVMMFRSSGPALEVGNRSPGLLVPAVLGLGMGLVSGLIGIGGGIFLSPLLLLTGWAGARTTAAVSAVFILVNSVAGLGGYVTAGSVLPGALPLWAAAALGGGWIGSDLGSRRLSPAALRSVLGAVLALAGTKLVLGL